LRSKDVKKRDWFLRWNKLCAEVLQHCPTFDVGELSGLDRVAGGSRPMQSTHWRRLVKSVGGNQNIGKKRWW